MLGSADSALRGDLATQMGKLSAGDHICAPFVNEDRLLDALALFVAGGYQRQDRVIVVGSPALKEALLQKLVGLGIVSHPPQQQLVWVGSDVFYGGPKPRKPEAMWDDLRQQSRLARDLGFSGITAAGAPPIAGDNEALLAYENGLDDVLKREGATLFCMYCKPQTPAGLMRALLTVHSHLWLQDRYFENLYFTPSALRGMQPVSEAQRLDWMLNRIFRSCDHETPAPVIAPVDATKHEDLRRLAFTLVRGIDHRDRLLGMAARQMRTALAQLYTAPSSLGTDEAQEAAERLAHLADRLEAIAILVSDPRDLSPRTLDLVAVAEKQIQSLRHEVAASAGPVTFHAEEPVVGRFDEELLSQTLEHLFRLALRHSCDGPVEVQVERQGPSGRITIRYQGIDGAGAAAALAGRQSHQIEIYDWLGIDLFFAREVLRRMDGTLTVGSWPDDTVLLSIELPRNTMSTFA